MPEPHFFETISVAELNARGLGCRSNVCSRDASGESPYSTKVLVVDDERVIADTLVLILDSKGFQATAAYSGESALGLAHADPPDILITDVMMPGMNGVELAIRAHDCWPRCRILLFSGNAATQELVETARQHGYNFPFLSKPVHPDTLLECLTWPSTTDEAA